MPNLNGYPISNEESMFLRELSRNGARFMMVGMVAAIMQGADTGTHDIDFWFGSTSDGCLANAARSVGGIFIWRADPPCVGGKTLSRIDIVNRMNGLASFEKEYAKAVDCQIDDFVVKLLPLERIIASKKAAGRDKDKAALPALKAALISRRYFDD